MFGIAPHAKAFIVPVPPEEIGVPSKNMIGFVLPKIVVFVIGDVLAIFRVDGPLAYLPVVAHVFVSGINKLQVLTGFYPSVHPGVIGLFQRGAIVPKRTGGEIGLVCREVDFNCPMGLREQVERADVATYASIRLFFDFVIHRGGAVGRMANDAVIGFDAPARPCPAHRNVAKFYHLVEIDKGLACGFFNGGPDFPSYFRQYHYFDVFIFQFHYLPFLVDGVIGVAIEAVIGVYQFKPGHGVRV